MTITDESINFFIESTENIAKYIKKKMKTYESESPNWQYDALKGALDVVEQKIELNEELDQHFRRQIYFIVNKLFME